MKFLIENRFELFFFVDALSDRRKEIDLILVSRRLMEEDDGVLSEIEPDSVPNEVRDWLAMTFTRSMSTIKRRPSDKPKFKSVAQAIRAGIMVDRFVSIVICIFLP